MNLTNFCPAKNMKAHSKRLFGSLNRRKKKNPQGKMLCQCGGRMEKRLKTTQERPQISTFPEFSIRNF